MAYRQSIPIINWLGVRRQNIDTLAQAHAAMSAIGGRGRPLEVGRPIGHAYILRMVSEFQAFVRDLHDLMAELIVDLAGTQQQYRAMLMTAATEGRLIDRGNAGLASMGPDFRRLGISAVDAKIAARNRRWKPVGQRGDRASYGDLIELRNALAHGNQRQLERLRQRGVMDTVSWARNRLPGLNRTAKALDRVVWDHVRDNFGVRPW